MKKNKKKSTQVGTSTSSNPKYKTGKHPWIIGFGIFGHDHSGNNYPKVVYTKRPNIDYNKENKND